MKVRVGLFFSSLRYLDIHGIQTGYDRVYGSFRGCGANRELIEGIGNAGMRTWLRCFPSSNARV